jgi:uncharacterized protein YutE (UPF0331/DUF86 family)
MDKERIIIKISELNDYLKEIEEIKPDKLEDYKRSIKDKRAVERLFQISIETVIDICNIMVSELKLGLPSSEDDIFSLLNSKKIISNDMSIVLSEMKGFRNLLVHKYGIIDDARVFEFLDNLDDFEKFKKEILNYFKINR